MSKRILVFGSSGQLATALRYLTGSTAHDTKFVGRDSADISAIETISEFVQWNPDVIVNAAAYTAVDAAESEASEAHAVNVTGTSNLVSLAERADVPLIHISTDYVFDGHRLSRPDWYSEEDETNPLNVYGLTKLEGENIVLQYGKGIVLRTSFINSSTGKNFVKTILRLASQDLPLRVVDDQLGCPTSASQLGEAILQIIDSSEIQPGLFHAASKGGASWWEFATEILNIAGIEKEIEAIPTSEFPLPAKRPADARMSSAKLKEQYGIEIADWKQGLRPVVKELMNERS